MAKQMSILKVKGTLDGLTFYKSKDGHLVRTKGGIEKGRIMSDPAFVRTRENISEFGSVAQTGKLFRQAIVTYLNQAKDSKTNSRLLQVMHQIKKMDVTSLRGARQVHVGLNSSLGKQLLKGFDFNQKAALLSVLYAPFESDISSGTITINNLVPNEQLKFPEGATHVSFRSILVSLDLATGSFATEASALQTLTLNMTSSSVELSPTAIPSVPDGIQLLFLLIEFSQELNGQHYPLRNGNFNVLHLVDLI